MAIERLKHLLKPLPSKFRQMKSHDPHDHWLIDELTFEEKDYFNSTHVLIGCPQHIGVQRNNGRIGAAEAPNQIREQLYRLQVPEQTEIRLFDAGNIITDIFDTEDELLNEFDDALEKIHYSLTHCVSKFLRDGKTVIVLGGGNDISYADVKAVSETSGPVTAINLDAHLDMRKAERMTSGTPYRRLIEDKYLSPDRLYEFGIRRESNSDYYLKDARKMGVHVLTLSELWGKGVVPEFRNILSQIGTPSLFLGLDIDSIQTSDAPGVSATSPVGLSGREVLQCLRLARAHKGMKVFEITELNPRYDRDNQTVKLAAQLIYGFLFG